MKTCSRCFPFPDGRCDFGCGCDDCNPTMTSEQVAAYYRSLVPLPACGREDCNGDDCGACSQAAYYDQIDHERAHSAGRLG